MKLTFLDVRGQVADPLFIQTPLLPPQEAEPAQHPLFGCFHANSALLTRARAAPGSEVISEGGASRWPIPSQQICGSRLWLLNTHDIIFMTDDIILMTNDIILLLCVKPFRPGHISTCRFYSLSINMKINSIMNLYQHYIYIYI